MLMLGGRGSGRGREYIFGIESIQHWFVTRVGMENLDTNFHPSEYYQLFEKMKVLEVD